VRQDLHDEIITAGAAAEHYGVTPDGGDWSR
jgi:hypothetical protein